MNTYLLRPSDQMTAQFLTEKELKKTTFKNGLWDGIVYTSRMIRNSMTFFIIGILVMYALSHEAMPVNGYFTLTIILLFMIALTKGIQMLANKFCPDIECICLESLFLEFPVKNQSTLIQTWKRENLGDEVFDAIEKHQQRNHSQPLLDLLKMQSTIQTPEATESKYLTLNND